MREQYKKIIEAIGENPNREGLQKTPERAAHAMEFLTQGYKKNLNEIINDALFPTENSEMVVVKNIEIYSLCEHHLLPFIGKCHIAYIPNDRILGLSKFARIVDMFSQRLQVQENLTSQIANALLTATNAKGVGVVIEAQHLCMMMRGVEKQHSTMTTSVMLGLLRDDARSRSEFLSLLHTQNCHS